MRSKHDNWVACIRRQDPNCHMPSNILFLWWAEMIMNRCAKKTTHENHDGELDAGARGQPGRNGVQHHI